MACYFNVNWCADLWNVFANFWIIYFQPALVGCFFHGRTLNKQRNKQTNKQTSVLLLNVKKNQGGYFHSEMKYLHQKHCSNYADIPSSRSRILASWEEMKNISALYKRNNKFIKKWLSSFDIVYCLVPLVILYRLLFKQFLTEDGWP